MKKKIQTTAVLKMIFGFILLSVLLVLILGEILLPVENPSGGGKCLVYEGEWELVLEDGTRTSVQIPGRYNAKRGEIVSLETTLPKDLKSTSFCMRASQQDMYVYIGDELRAEYTTKETRLFGRDSASAFVLFNLYDEDAGKVLRIDTLSHSEYSGFINEGYIGDKFDIALTLIKESYMVLLVSVFMFIISALTIFVGCILRFVYKKKIDIVYLGLAIFILSLNMIVESRIRQFFLTNVSIASHAGFMLTMLLPFPFLVYVNRIQKGRYVRAHVALAAIVLANFMVSSVLQIVNVADFADTMYISYFLIIAMIVMILITILIDVKRKKIREYDVVLIGFAVMIVAALWEVFITFFPQMPFLGGVALSVGLIVFLFMAGIKTVKDMVNIEQEKQVAVAQSAAKANFIANMSHEIRTPINAIIGMNEMILRENRDKVVEEYAVNIKNSSRLLLGLINDVLDFSKIEAGKMDIVETEYELAALLSDVINSVRLRAESKNLSLDIKIEETLPSVLKGDEIRIRQIINNLLSNAVKYTKEGSIAFSVRGVRFENVFHLQISVRDTGIGIKKEDINRLFSSFRRLEQDKNRYIEGTGLGLNITKQLVDLMNGNISVESEYTKGSVFTVQIPQQVINKMPLGKIEKAFDVRAEKEETPEVLYAPEAAVLIVDDNNTNLAVTKALLKRTGIQPDLASGGRECLEMCKEKKYDLILMDHMMPDPDGIETLHMLQGEDNNPNRFTKVIVLTANAVAGVAEEYVNEGFADYLSKPIMADELEAMLAKYLPRDKVMNYDGIDKEIGMKNCGGREDLYKEATGLFCEQGKAYLIQLTECLATMDYKGYAVVAHAIKGSSKILGAIKLSEKALMMEEAAKAENEEVLRREEKAFLEEFKSVIAVMEKELAD